MMESERMLQLLGDGSVQIAFLVAAIFLVRLVLRRAISAKWLFLFWLVLIVRMLLPVPPESPTSFLNFSLTSPTHHVSSPMPALTERVGNSGESKQIALAQPRTAPLETASSPRRQFILVGVWVGGAALFLACFGLRVSFTNRWIVAHTKPLPPRLGSIFEQSRETVGGLRNVRLTVVSAQTSPGAWGFFRAQVLFPEGLIQTLSESEIRHVFLHELSHLKRWDHYIEFAYRIGQALYWFHPLVWIVRRYFTTDRELACDESVLAMLPTDERVAYGETLLRVAEESAQPASFPALAMSMADCRSGLGIRIGRIARKRDRALWISSLVGTGVISILVALGGTSAKTTRSNQYDVNVTILRLADSEVVTSMGWSQDDRRLMDYYRSRSGSGDVILEAEFSEIVEPGKLVSVDRLQPLEYPIGTPDDLKIGLRGKGNAMALKLEERASGASVAVELATVHHFGQPEFGESRPPSFFATGTELDAVVKLGQTKLVQLVTGNDGNFVTFVTVGRHQEL